MGARYADNHPTVKLAIRSLEAGPLITSEIAKELRLSKSGAKKLVTYLVERGVIYQAEVRRFATTRAPVWALATNTEGG